MNHHPVKVAILAFLLFGLGATAGHAQDASPEEANRALASHNTNKNVVR